MAAVAWAARAGWLHLADTPAKFLGSTVAAYLFAALALGERVADKLPRTPSRTTPGPFIGRIVTGGLSGAALTAGSGGMRPNTLFPIAGVLALAFVFARSAAGGRVFSSVEERQRCSAARDGSSLGHCTHDVRGRFRAAAETESSASRMPARPMNVGSYCQFSSAQPYGVVARSVPMRSTSETDIAYR
jgi:uncharacterized membrane protein